MYQREIMLKKIKWAFAKTIKTISNPHALNRCTLNPNAWVGRGSDLTDVVMGRYSSVDRYCWLVNVEIGNFSGVSADCVIGAATHPMSHVSTSFTFYGGKNALNKNWNDSKPLEIPLTKIENDVWIGQGSFIKPGVTIHNGAVIGMGSVVTKDVPPYELWAGNPAKKIRSRFDSDIIERLLKIQWWDWDDSKIEKFAPYFDNPHEFIRAVEGDVV